MFSILVLVITCIGIFVFLYKQKQICDEAVAATKAWCDAGEALKKWRLANPAIPIGLSSVGRALVIESIRSFREFMRTHPFLKWDQEYLDYLYALLDDRGPPPPGKSKRPLIPIQLAHASCFYVVTPMGHYSNFLGIVR